MSSYRRFSRTKAAVTATFAVVLIAAAAQPTLSTTAVPRPRLAISKPSNASSMGFVPSHLLRKIAENPQNSDTERARAQSTLDHDEKVTEESLAQSRLSRPLEALQCLVDDSSISYSDKVKEELQAILDPARSRWPYMPDVPVSRELKGVLTTNGLWKEDPDEQDFKDKSKEEVQDNREAGNEGQKKNDQQK